MKRKIRSYPSADVVIEYDVKRCIHSAECVRGLPEVFEPGRVPWIEASRADADAIALVIERCPTGALHYRRTDGGHPEAPDAENVARPGADGPLYVRGRIRLELADGDIMEETRVALCRCGASGDKPFCDGSHVDAGFTDPGAIQGGRLVPVDETEERTDDQSSVTFVSSPNGPLLVRGPLRVEGTCGSVTAGRKGALCRCGLSATKPFCDGSHRDSFESD